MKVLLAFPDRDLLLSVGEILRLQGFDAVTSFDGIQALTRLAGETFDLAIVDDQIPRVPWGEIVRVARESGTAFLLLTGAEREEKNLSPGMAKNVLRYPFLPRELLEKIRQICPNSPNLDTAGDEHE